MDHAFLMSATSREDFKVEHADNKDETAVVELLVYVLYM